MSKNREWLVYQVSESGLSAGPLGACETLICEGILCVLVCEKLKNFLARRGSASRPARPRRLKAGAAKLVTGK